MVVIKSAGGVRARIVERLHGKGYYLAPDVLEGPAESLRQNSDIKEFYLGLNEASARKSYRDTKNYRRRKRWLS